MSGTLAGISDVVEALQASGVLAAARLHAPAIVAGAAMLYALYKAIRFSQADADTPVIAATRKMPPDAFSGQVVLIIGASGGIGAGLALELAERGAVLILAARRMPELVALAEKCRAIGAHDAMALRFDALGSADSHAQAIAFVIKKYGRIDVLVANAGRSQRGLAEKTPISVDKQMFDLNVIGTLSVVKAVLPHMLERKAGVIALTSSIAGKTGSPISATYSATKAALNGFASALRMEVAWRGTCLMCCRFQP